MLLWILKQYLYLRMRMQVTKNKARDEECVYEPVRKDLSAESKFCVLLEAFNTSSSVLQAFPINWQAASNWEEASFITHSVS